MPNISSIIKNVRNIMRNEDQGISGDAQRLEQLGWMLFLKIIDDKDQELEIIRKGYKSVIPEKFQWRNWAADPEGITGDDLLLFIDHPADGLFANLKTLQATAAPQRAGIVREVFDGLNNYMKSGYAMRKVINQLNGFDFNDSEDRHIFGTIYESILIELRDAGNKGEYYTPRAITQLMTQMTAPRLGEKVLDPAAGTGGFLSAAIDHVREKDVRTLDDDDILQKSITGWEYKPVAYVLGLTNLVLHGMDVPDYHYRDSLKTEYNAIGPKQQVDCILANPPFGAGVADGVETNFPSSYRCRESADLFIVLILQLLKPGGQTAASLATATRSASAKNSSPTATSTPSSASRSPPSFPPPSPQTCCSSKKARPPRKSGIGSTACPRAKRATPRPRPSSSASSRHLSSGGTNAWKATSRGR
jgi:type I restriction enzyme M protein